MSEKATQRTGKEGELKVLGELLRRGFDIYVPLVDIGGIDCIVKTNRGYVEIQIKTREKITGKQLLFDVKKFKPRNNFFIICYFMKEQDVFWVLSSKIFKDNATYIKKYNRYRIIVGKEDSNMRQALWSYRNNFFQLKT